VPIRAELHSQPVCIVRFWVLQIDNYQEKTGIPTEEEAEKVFVEAEAGMNYETYKDLKKQDSVE
jgi:hypothetical protein